MRKSKDRRDFDIKGGSRGGRPRSGSMKKIKISKMLFKVIMLVAVAALVMSTLAACGEATGKLSKIQRNGELVVYTDPNFYPFEFPGDDGGVEGVDIEIAKAIAADLGVTLKIEESNFDAIIMSIKGGKGDIAISGLTITDERKESVDFSDPYINSVQYMILRSGSPYSVIEDLAGQSIGVAMGYTGSLLIDDEINIDEGVLFGTGASFTEYPSAMEASLDLMNGKVEAVIMDEHVAKSIAAQNDGLVTFELAYADGAVAAEEYGVAIPKGNRDLLTRINAVVNSLKSQGKIEEWVLQFSD
jgi:polar amino acid transport system substrate-binding protein